MNIRRSARVVLLNTKKELLLMCAEDPDMTSASGRSYGRFWFLTGGGIEPGETVQDAALRELSEETGFASEDITLGPVVWQGPLELRYKGAPTHFEQDFIVAHTRRTDFACAHLTETEKRVVKGLRWFSLEEIQAWPEPIFPLSLVRHLPDILQGHYPCSPLAINASEEPAL